MIILKNKLILTLLTIIKLFRNKFYRGSVLQIKNYQGLTILGGGPSVDANLEYYTTTKDKFMVVNDFVHSVYYIQIKPQYYILLDPDYWDISVSGKIEKNRLNTYNKINESTDWDLIFYAPFKARNYINSVIKNKKIRILYYNDLYVDGYDYFKYKLYKYNFGIPLAQNVLVACLYLALLMGYKKIKIDGFEHSWHNDIVNDHENRLKIKRTHFYDEKKVDYEFWYKNGSQKELFRMDEIFLNFSKVFWGYREISLLANRLGAEIINRSKNSFIDSFKKE